MRNTKLNRVVVNMSGELLKQFYLEFTKISQSRRSVYQGKSKFCLKLMRLGLANVGECYKEVPLLIESDSNERVQAYLTSKVFDDFAKCYDKYNENAPDMARILIYIGLKKKREQDEQNLRNARTARNV